MDSKEHLLVLKVMRLTKPSFVLSTRFAPDPRDALAELLAENDLNSVPNCSQIAVGQMLSLPQNFGNIFLGETFSSYISVHNDSNYTCRDIVIKADLQTASQRLPLSAANSTTNQLAAEPGVSELLPDRSLDQVICHEVKELGTHILVCAVSYTSHTLEKLYFRKFFKFQVLKPLDVKTKFYNIETEDVYLEAQIQNITPDPIHLEKVILDPAPNFIVEELNRKDVAADEDCSALELVSQRLHCLQPSEVRQFLYRLLPKFANKSNHNNERSSEPYQVGKLDITWRSHMGERGRLQTSPLLRMNPGYGDIKVTVEEIPAIVKLEESFLMTCRVENCSERNMDLVLFLMSSMAENSHNNLQNYTFSSSQLVWCDVSGRKLGSLAPGQSIQLNLQLLALAPGLHTISGLRLRDTFLKRVYEHDDLVQVLVTA